MTGPAAHLYSDGDFPFMRNHQRMEVGSPTIPIDA
jgi:hypothetical protein